MPNPRPLKIGNSAELQKHSEIALDTYYTASLRDITDSYQTLARQNQKTELVQFADAEGKANV